MSRMLRFFGSCFYLFVFDFLRILYADIVNFTPLSEKFTPPELVQILNKLFGKFDQLAQVIFMVWKH
jgi:class 3 adenylate cyclase